MEQCQQTPTEPVLFLKILREWVTLEKHHRAFFIWFLQKTNRHSSGAIKKQKKSCWPGRRFLVFKTAVLERKKKDKEKEGPETATFLI